MIQLKKSLSKWIEVGANAKDEKVEFLIDYPTIKQGQHLDELRYDAWGKYVSDDISPKVDMHKILLFKRQFLKYTIKDWRGLEDKCILKDNELEDETWWALVRNIKTTNELYELIAVEIELTEEDKKKLDSVNTSQTKANSTE